MTRVRWVNGNQIAYGSGGWYRYVLDVDTPGDGGISVWWGVETNVSINDSSNVGDTNVNGGASPFSNVSFVHGSGGGVTWLRGEGFWIAPGSSISFSGYVRNLADFSGGGGTSSVGASWTRPALPPNQMAAPIVNTIAATTHQTHFSAPGTNGTGITAFYYEYHYAEGGLVYSGPVYSSPIYAQAFIPNRQYAVRMFADSAAGPGPWSAFTYFTQAVAVPIAPSALSVTRNSDTSHSLSWTRGDQTQGPYSSQEVLRRQAANGVMGAFSVIASLSGAAASFVDTTTVANMAYQYQIRASNASGTATSPGSSVVFTTPGQPINQSAAKDSANNIVVTWAPPAGTPSIGEVKYEVFESSDAGATWTSKTVTATNVQTWTHSSPDPALPHVYAIRAIIATTGVVGTGLAGVSAYTNTVQLLTPPAAPTNLQNTPAGTADRAQPITLTWQHNPLDSSPQTKYILQHRLVGATPWTIVSTTTAVSSHTLAANTYPAGTAFEWQVKTYGLHVNPGPNSSIATVQISSLPAVSISSPAASAVVGGTVLSLAWVYSDPDNDPQGSWEATLYAANGSVLEFRSGADESDTTTFAYRLQEAAYSVKVRVRDSRGLWSTLDTRSFTVTYPLPPVPIVTSASWDWKRGTVELTISVPAPTVSEVTPVALEVWRSIDNGPFKRLVADLPPLTVSYLDFTPTVAGKNSYVIQALSALPSASQSSAADVLTPAAGDGRPAVWLSGGTDFTKVGRLASEVSVDTARPLERVLQQYAGRPLPMEHSGEHITETWDVNGNLNLTWSTDVDLPQSPEDWTALGALPGPFLLRAPSLFGGGTIYAYVSVDGPKVSRQKGGNVYTVSFTATRTES